MKVIEIARVKRLPILLIATFRPEFQASWVGQAHVTALSLSRLGRRDGPSEGPLTALRVAAVAQPSSDRALSLG